ncbi:MAG: glutamine synthetase, partial [Desulfobacteraceae bacterium]|nr:glutamine synthetase [Desulfobacteraceae bacterium]
FAPTKIAWSYDNRTTGYRIVGSKQSYRPENRIPGADINPYLTFAGILASGIYGIENKIEPPKEFSGNAYAAEDLPQCPLSLLEAAELFNNSKAARSLFGDHVVDYLVHCAFLENKDNEKTVTDWELFRYFERI